MEGHVDSYHTKFSRRSHLRHPEFLPLSRMSKSRLWADFESTLGRPWADFGPTLGQLRADSGPTLG